MLNRDKYKVKVTSKEVAKNILETLTNRGEYVDKDYFTFYDDEMFLAYSGGWLLLNKRHSFLPGLEEVGLLTLYSFIPLFDK